MKFSYLLFTSIYILPWLYFYKKRPDLRKEMIWASLITALGGLFCEKYWYSVDWVKPTTITGTTVGIEDFILGFGTGGIGSVIYKELFKKDGYRSSSVYRNSRTLIALPVLIGFLIAHFLFIALNIFSFFANAIGFGLIILIIFLLRKDLIIASVTGGLLLAIISAPAYWITFKIFPEWLPSYWRLDAISKHYIVGIPYEDIVWWFIVGMILSIIYDYVYGLRLRKQRLA